MMQGAYSPGSLVRARGRDWIVLLSQNDGVLRLRICPLELLLRKKVSHALLPSLYQFENSREAPT